MLACVLALAIPAFAQPAKIKANYSGVIEKYDAGTRTLVVKQKNKQGEFAITDTTEVLQNKVKADTSALTAGRKVDVEFVMDGATKTAVKAKLK